VKVEAPLRLKLAGVSKSFPGVRANDNVNLSVKPGEIHALLGENGAGKSTLVKMIYGILAPDEGEIVFDGSAVRISNPRAARRLGIGMVFQHFSLFEAMTVLENIALGLDARLSPRELLAEFNRVLEAYHLKLDPRRVVSTLSVGERQRIEIVRALLLNPKLLIMDEPTSVLTPQEVEQLFETLRKLAASGCSILYISLTDSGALTGRDRMAMVRFGLIDPGKATQYAAEMIGAYTVTATGPGALAGSLSGGNLQKFIMGREILQRPEALVVCQPTWGVDAGAAAAIHQAIVDLAARGSAVIVISQDLDELLTLCDTIAVINLGRLSAPMKVGEVSIEEIGLLMGGVHGDPVATVEMIEALHAHPA
jgi:ABC-type uncharacterized transport system ATPase subunit